MLTAADLVNDDSKVARVRVAGLINGEPFVVERATRRYAMCFSLPRPMSQPLHSTERSE